MPAVLLWPLVTFLGWWVIGSDLGTAVLSAIAVLLVACPCAMGLATPVAMMVGCGRASALGILIRNGDALERLARVDTVAFDKTGTLTMGIATVVAVAPAEGSSTEEVLDLAAAVEADIEHPIARAICAAHRPRRRAVDVAVLPGVGVAGRLGGQAIRVVRAHEDLLPAELEAGAEEFRRRGETAVAVVVDDQPIGVLAISTPLRQEAVGAIARLHELGIRTAILSGDSEEAVRDRRPHPVHRHRPRRAGPRAEARGPRSTPHGLRCGGHGGRRHQRRPGTCRRRRGLRHRQRF